MTRADLDAMRVPLTVVGVAAVVAGAVGVGVGCYDLATGLRGLTLLPGALFAAGGAVLLAGLRWTR